MADSKLADLTAITTPATTDILYLVHDPAGTPVDRKITVANLLGASGGLSVLAVKKPTDGVTATPNASYASFSTAFSQAVTTSGTKDIHIHVMASINRADDSVVGPIALYRDGTLLASTGLQYNGGGTRVHTFTLDWVDEAVAAGTYTYEVRAGSFNATTITLFNNTSTTPSLTASTNKGRSIMIISAA